MDLDRTNVPLRLIAFVLVMLAVPVPAFSQWSSDAATNNLICTATGDQKNPAIAADGAGGAIIAWFDYRSSVDYDLYAQRINAAGVVQWATNGVPISTPTGFQLNVRLLSDGSGGALIAWQDSRGGGYDIYAQRINASGVRQWVVSGDSNGVVISNAGGSQDNPVRSGEREGLCKSRYCKNLADRYGGNWRGLRSARCR